MRRVVCRRTSSTGRLSLLNVALAATISRLDQLYSEYYSRITPKSPDIFSWNVFCCVHLLNVHEVISIKHRRFKCVRIIALNLVNNSVRSTFSFKQPKNTPNYSVVYAKANWNFECFTGRYPVLVYIKMWQRLTKQALKWKSGVSICVPFPNEGLITRLVIWWNFGVSE